MKLNVHCVVMVQAPAIVNCTLSKDCDWKLLVEGIREEALNLPRVTQVPTARAGKTCKGRSTNQTPLRKLQILCDLVICSCFNVHTGTLSFGVCYLAVRLVDLFLGDREGMFVLFDLHP